MLNFRVDGKLALVTGSSRGIGLSVAAALAESGADMIGASSKLEASGSDLEKAVTKAGKKFYPYQCDLSKRDSIYSFLEKVKANHPRIDILINNAGHILRKPVAEHPDDYWDTIININLNAQFILAREIGKRMLEQASGKIVFTCSLLSFQGGVTVPAMRQVRELWLPY
jgi:2-deoxy-D-gluconate 3-dehydrogenase